MYCPFICLLNTQQITITKFLFVCMFVCCCFIRFWNFPPIKVRKLKRDIGLPKHDRLFTMPSTRAVIMNGRKMEDVVGRFVWTSESNYRHFLGVTVLFTYLYVFGSNQNFQCHCVIDVFRVTSLIYNRIGPFRVVFGDFGGKIKCFIYSTYLRRVYIPGSFFCFYLPGS